MTGSPPVPADRATARPAGDPVLPPGIRLGRWAGVPVGAHWSAIITLVLLAALLATAELPTVRPHEGAAAYWAAGSLAAALFLAAVLAHEVAHAVVARHYGLTVRGITLWMLGGVTDLGGEPSSPRADALIAVSGPATSLGLGVVLLAVSTALPAGLAAVSLAWLGSVNILLAVFNLLPGAPLDGGRLLRALLWWRSHDRARAAQSAARVGRGLGMTLIALGVFALVSGNPFGIWLALVGWFVLSSASVEGAASSSARLRGTRAEEVMSPVRFVAPDWWTVELAVAHLPDQAAPLAFPLLDLAGHVSGVLTLDDLESVPITRRAERRLRAVARQRRADPLVVDVHTDVAEIADRLRTHGGVAVVLDDGRPVGVITAAQLSSAARLRELRAASAPSRS